MNLRVASMQKVVAAGAAMALVLGLGGWGFWRLTLRIWQSDFVVRELQSKIETLREDRERAGDLAMILERHKSDLERINGFFVKRERPVGFIEALERIAVASGNTIVIDVDEGRNDERHLGFRLTVEGEEKNLFRYARLLETLPYKLEMGEIMFQRRASDSSSPRTGGTNRLILSLRVRAR